MNTITHGLAPVLVVHALCRGAWQLTGRQLSAVALAGAAPDLINPHITLQARMNSWSHGLPAWLVVTCLLFLLPLISRGYCPWRLSLACSLAYLFHLVCDALSGGINWLSPAGEWVWGRYWYPPVWWVPTDVMLILACYVVSRALPRWRVAQQ